MAARSLLLGTTVVIAAACMTTPTPPESEQPGQHTSAHFQWTLTGRESARIAELARRADAEAVRIRQALDIAPAGIVRVTFYESHAAMAAAVEPIVGPLPAFAGGLVTSATAIHVLSMPLDSPAQMDAAVQVVAHEFVHCVTLQMNPSIANNPRWLWETAALYLAGPTGNPAHALAGGPLTPAILNTLSNLAIYDVGHSLGRFIVERHGGLPTLRSLIRSNGDTGAALGRTLETLLREWELWFRGD